MNLPVSEMSELRLEEMSTDPVLLITTIFFSGSQMKPVGYSQVQMAALALHCKVEVEPA